MEPFNAIVSSSQDDLSKELQLVVAEYRKKCENIMKEVDERLKTAKKPMLLAPRQETMNIRCSRNSQIEATRKSRIEKILLGCLQKAFGLKDPLDVKETMDTSECGEANKRVQFSGIGKSDEMKPLIDDLFELKKTNTEKLPIIEVSSKTVSKRTELHSQSRDSEGLLLRVKNLKSKIDAEVQDLRKIVVDLEELYRDIKNEKSPTEKDNGDSKTISRSCLLCLDQNLPIIAESLSPALLRVIGNRRLFDILLTVYLRPDGIYHINVRDLSQDNSLCCMLCSEYAMKEALGEGLFEQIATFCVLEPGKGCDNSRQSAGGIAPDNELDVSIKELVHKNRNWIESQRIKNYRASLEIAKINKKHVLPDDDANYPCLCLEICSLGDLSNSAQDRND